MTTSRGRCTLLLMVASATITMSQAACEQPDATGAVGGPGGGASICKSHNRLSATALAKQELAVAAARGIAEQTQTALTPTDRAGTDSATIGKSFSSLRYGLNKFGTLRYLYGTKLALPIAGAKASNPEQAARLFVAAYPALLGLDAARDALVLKKTSNRPAGGTYVTFTQTHDGVPCAGTYVTVILDAQAQVKGLIADVFPEIDAPTVPAISSAAAVGTAVGSGGNVTKAPELVFVTPSHARSVNLAWRLLANDQSGAPWRHTVDAVTGLKLGSQPLRQQDHTKTLYRLGNLKRQHLPYYCGCCTPNPYNPDACGLCTCLASKETQAWNAMVSITQYWQDRFGRWSYNGANGEMRTNIEVIPDYNTLGFFDPETKQVTVNEQRPSVTMDTMAHEWQHAVRDTELGPPHTGDPGAVNEGLADTFSLVMENDWLADGESAQNPPPGTCRPRWGQPHGYRDYCFPYSSDWANDDYYWNGSLIFQSGYLAFGGDAPPDGCAQDSDCPGWSSGTTESKCACKAETWSECASPQDRHCVKTRNNVTVPYRGRWHGWAPYYYIQDWNYLSSETQLHDFPWILELGACEYDLAQSPPRFCDFTAVTARLAMLAQGFWTEHTQVTQSAEPLHFRTNRRPALVQNLYPSATTCTPDLYQPSCATGMCADGYCTEENWAAVFHRAETGGQVFYNQSLNGVSFGFKTPVLAASRYKIYAGSGITAVRNPAVSGSKELALVYKGTANNRIRYVLADLTASSPPSFGSEQLIATTAQTDATPMGINFQSHLWFIYKVAGGTALKYIMHGENQPSTIPNAQSSDAPSAVVAAGRLWVFFRGTGGLGGDSSVYFTSYNGTSWTAVQTLPTVEPNQPVASQYRPESIYYAGRTWLLLTPAGGWGVAMVSFTPSIAGQATEVSPMVSLRWTDYLVSPDATYVSAFEHGKFLRLYYSHEDGYGTMWHIAKSGGG